MGNEPCCCPDNGRSGEKSFKTRKISVENNEWAQAINNGNLQEVQNLLSNNKDLINEVVNNTHGYTALHLCVINKRYTILEYLLQNNSQIDIPNTINGNTALHEACKLNDVKASFLLIQYGADTKTTNNNGKTPIQLTTSNPVKQAFKNPSAYRKTNQSRGEFGYNKVENSRSISNNSDSIRSETRDMSFSNDETRDYSYTQRINEHELTKSPTSPNKNITKHRSESSVSHQLFRKGTMKNTDPTTWFGKEMGVELEQVADFMRRLPNRGKMWDAFLGKDKTQITQEKKNRDLFRLVFGIIYATIKKQNRSAPQPSKSIAKLIMYRIVELLVDEQNVKSNSLNVQSVQLTYTLSKEKFVNEFHAYLYQCSDDIRNGVIKPKH